MRHCTAQGSRSLETGDETEPSNEIGGYFMHIPRKIATILLTFYMSAEVAAEESIVFLSCKPSQSWIEALIDLSPLDPPPSLNSAIELLKSNGLHEIEASFDPKRESDLVGLGKFMGHPMPYFITEKFVTFMTADDDGGENSILNRYTGILILGIEPKIPIQYQCERKERKY